MAPNVLTPLQERVLQALFENDLAERGYYLTGGTALAAFYLQHRYSEDLDFFTRKSGPLRNDKEAAFDGEEGTLAFAVNLLAVQEFAFLPRMIKSINLERLCEYFVPLAEKLIQGLRPHGD